jgi:hypothetical protein
MAELNTVHPAQIRESDRQDMRTSSSPPEVGSRSATHRSGAGLQIRLIPAGVKADSLTGFQTGKHLTMSIGLRDWVNA